MRYFNAAVRGKIFSAEQERKEEERDEVPSRSTNEMKMRQFENLSLKNYPKASAFVKNNNCMVINLIDTLIVFIIKIIFAIIRYFQCFYY